MSVDVKMAKDRYVSFKDIDCYKYAVEVLDALHELFIKEPESKNAFWDRFLENIDPNYKEVHEKEGCKDILYQVCSNVFYISDLFDEYEFEKGVDLLSRIELECC